MKKDPLADSPALQTETSSVPGSSIGNFTTFSDPHIDVSTPYR